MKKNLLLVIMLMLPMFANADECGTCGDNLTWSFTEATGTLVISGTGPMYDYNNSSNIPWKNHDYDIKSVVIEDGVTSIGNKAFSYCRNLESIKLGRDIVSVGDEITYSCYSLASIEVSTNNSHFDSREDCNAIIETSTNTLVLGCKSSTIPYGIASIGEKAFYACGITTLDIPNTVRSIGEEAFYCCSYLNLSSIGDYVTSIGMSAFMYCRSLSSIKIPKSVTNIGHNAFSGCTSVASIKVISGNTVYDSRDNCNAIIETETNTLIAGCQNTDIPNTVSKIGYCAFYNSSLTNITIPTSVCEIGDHAFCESRELTSVSIPNSVTSIGHYAFMECRGLTSIIIPNSVNTIGSCAFDDTGLKEVIIEDGDSELSFGGQVFWSSPIENLHVGRNFNCSVPAGYTSSPFYGLKELAVLTFSNNVTTIPTFAFCECSALTSIIIPSSVTSIGQYAFDKTAWYNNQPEGMVYAGKVAYKYKGNNAGHIQLAEGTLGIASNAFYYCGLQSISIPNSLKNIDSNAFEGSGLKKVIVQDITSWCKITFNGWYSNPLYFSKHLFSDDNTEITNLLIPNGVTDITDYAFYGCEGITSLTIENGVKSIGSHAFENCKGLLNVTIPNSLNRIGDHAFTSCYELIEIEIPQGVSTIEVGAFNWCRSLESVTIASSVITIDDFAFGHCSSLTSVKVGNRTPVTIGSNTFTYRENATLYVPKGSKAAYEAADYWKEFKEIIEYANTGAPTANTLSLSAIEGNRGKQVVLPVALNNQHQITGLQMDLYLPAGVTIAKKANGKMMISTTDRMDGNYTLTGEAMDGFVRILGYSGDSDAFTGTSGDILNITLDLNSEMNAGDYTIQLKDIVLSDVNNTEYHPANVEAKLTVKSYTLGDVDDSGAININDVVCIINHILNRSNGTFISEAADVDENGTININDVVTLINRYILMRDNAPAYNNGSSRASMAESNYLHLDNIAIKPGETKEITMLLSNSNEVRGIQGNIKLPAGLSFVNKSNGRPDVKNIDARSEDFTLSCAVQDDGSMTFAQYSADGFSYTGSEGGIFTFKIKAADSATAGSYAVDLKGVVLSIDGVGYDIPDRSSSVVVTGTDGISEIKTTEPVDVYTLDGRKIRSKASDMSELPNGVYIVNGKKIVVK